MLKQVKVKTNLKHQSIKEEPEGSLIIHLKSHPIDGKENEELIKFLAKNLDVPKSNIRIKLGSLQRQKLIEIDIDL